MPKKITVLGGGPGGYTAGIRGAQKGAQVTLIEQNSLGGTCLNWGCIPTKAYIESIEALEKADLSSLQLKSIKKRKDTIVGQLVKGVRTLLEKNKVELVNGRGRVISPREVEVILPDGTNRLIENDALVLATGSESVILPIPGMDLPQVVGSKKLLELEQIPAHLVIIGGGVIGLEFAQVFAGLGSKVTVVEMLPKILATFDNELVCRLQPVLKRKGIQFLTKTKITHITAANNGVQVHISGNKADSLSADTVLIATGRQPHLQGINTGDLGLSMEGKFIKVDNKMATNLPNVYAIGDIVPTPMLAHIASYEAEIAIKSIFEENAEADYQAVPTCVYTYGMVKIIAQKDTGVILGAQILGPQASELIHQLTLAVRWRLTAEQLAETIHAHPTLSESILEASHSVFGKPVHFV